MHGARLCRSNNPPLQIVSVGEIKIRNEKERWSESGTETEHEGANISAL